MLNIKELSSAFLSNVEVEKISLKNLPNYVFFCGGGLNDDDLLKIGTGQEAQVKSLRSAVLHYLSSKEKELYQDVILAEKFHDWLGNMRISPSRETISFLVFEPQPCHTNSLLPTASSTTNAVKHVRKFSFLA